MILTAFLAFLVLAAPQDLEAARAAAAQAMRLWQKEGDFNGALQAFAKAVEAAPDDVDVRFQRAQFFLWIWQRSSGEQETTFHGFATEEFAAVSRLDPDSTMAGVARDLLRMLNGERLFEDPQFACEEGSEAHGRAHEQFTTGEYESAREAYAEALEACPDDPVAHWSLADADFVLGRYDEAAAGFLRAIELRPWYASAYRFLGDCHAARGKKEEALEAFAMAIVCRPTYEAAWSALRGAAEALGRPCRRTFEARPVVTIDEACDVNITVPDISDLRDDGTDPRGAVVMAYGTSKANALQGRCNGEKELDAFGLELEAVGTTLTILSEMMENDALSEPTPFWQLLADARSADRLEAAVHLHFLSRESLPLYLEYREEHSDELLAYLLELVVPAPADEAGGD